LDRLVVALFSGGISLSKVGRTATNIAKQIVKERERQRKEEQKETLRLEKEHVRLEKELATAREFEEQKAAYNRWLTVENQWHKVFTGELLPVINWEEKNRPHPFIEPEPPKTESLVPEAVREVKKHSITWLLVGPILGGVFLYSAPTDGDLVASLITGSVGLFMLAGTIFVWWRRKGQLVSAESKALAEKRRLEEEYEERREKVLQEHNRREEQRLAKVGALISGKSEAIAKTAYSFMNKVRWPNGVSFKVEVPSADVLSLKIFVPGLDVVNHDTARWDERRGVTKFSPKPKKELVEQYGRLIAAIIFRAGWEVFRSCPKAQDIISSVFTIKHHRTKGTPYEACILSCILTRNGYNQVNFKNVDYLAALENFQLRYAPRGLELPGDVYPYSQKRQSELNPEDILQIDVDSMTGEQFEDFIKILIEKMGLKAEKTQKSHDGGIDIWAFNDHEVTGGKYIIQCKRWTPTIPVEVIRDLYWTVSREKADKGILITTSKISMDGHKFIEEANHKIPITLIEGTQLKSLIAKYKLAN
jgi:hypothetical protein